MRCADCGRKLDEVLTIEHTTQTAVWVSITNAQGRLRGLEPSRCRSCLDRIGLTLEGLGRRYGAFALLHLYVKGAA